MDPKKRKIIDNSINKTTALCLLFCLAASLLFLPNFVSPLLLLPFPIILAKKMTRSTKIKTPTNKAGGAKSINKISPTAMAITNPANQGLAF